ncbi:uncharacterized protein HGUI_03842 [Hanseniaspora guilliermondii]|uniref:Alpha-1,2-mannosyltransferase MNN2 n=1 Tax=Hanseniaspora guilliermondii TaxID=56406 RepID=A0A1L0CSR0_9ASCO|nr:uncharacterized protein HGUI_03842 [Hanseniaspora guilliermondii]
MNYQRFIKFIENFKVYIIVNIVIIIFLIHTLFNISSEEKFNLIKLNNLIESRYNPQISLPLSLRFDAVDTIKVRDAKIQNSFLGEYLKRAPELNYQAKDLSSLSKNNLEKQYLRLNSKILNTLRESHTSIINDISKKNFFKQANFIKKYNGDGIVFVGGGDHSAMVYAIIKVIRILTRKLPIEVLIPDMAIQESDVNFCNMIQDMNAKCIYLKDYFENEFFNYKTYQYKSLALLLSSFDNVLLLDADDYPLVNLDNIFDHKTFKENGMIVWPDMWHRTTHPFFYESGNKKINMNHKVRSFLDSYSNNYKNNDVFHDYQGTLPDPASETGQLMINKTRHFKTLLLSYYYNLYGPSVFYHLLTQLGAGQGDKETFIAAAHMLNLPFYQVFSSSSLDGVFQNDNFKSTGYYQKDFRLDSLIKDKIMENTVQTNEDSLIINDLNKFKDIKEIPVQNLHFQGDKTTNFIMFAHINFPKFHPLTLAYHKEYYNEKGHYRALSLKKNIGFIDLEREVCNVYYNVFCLNKEDPFKQLVDNERLINKDILCTYYKNRTEYLNNTSLLTMI